MTLLLKPAPLIASGLVSLIIAQIGATCHAAPLTDAPRPFRFHDPSSIFKERDDYWVFATGNGIISEKSRNLVHWESGPRVFARPARLDHERRTRKSVISGRQTWSSSLGA